MPGSRRGRLSVFLAGALAQMQDFAETNVKIL